MTIHRESRTVRGGGGRSSPSSASKGIKLSKKMPAPPPPVPNPAKLRACDSSQVGDSDALPPWAKISLTSAEAEIEKLIARNELKDAEVTYFCQVEPILQDGPQ